jgi:hypothetical protein
MQIGEKINFGEYEWRVLDVQNNAALIISEEIIEQRPYHDVYVDITWADCSLRTYLNSEFYEKFNERDKSKIIPVTNKNPDNPWYGANGGDDTKDKIFILSLEDVVCRYFGDSSANLYNRSKNQKYWFERKDANNSKRSARLNDGEWWYWLRTPGRINIKATYVKRDGIIGIQGNNIQIGNLSEADQNGGVRPALWLRTE